MKAASKRGKPEQWQEALDNLWQLEADTKKMLEKYFAKEELNEYLLSNYDICMVPAYFWQLVADLENGKYKSKKCKPIEMRQLLSMWKWGQKNLNQIAVNNKTNRSGPTNDSDRIKYDLAILLNHTEDYKKYKAKIDAEDIERKIYKKENVKVDYNKIKPINNNNNGLDDISDLLDDLI